MGLGAPRFGGRGTKDGELLPEKSSKSFRREEGTRLRSVAWAATVETGRRVRAGLPNFPPASPPPEGQLAQLFVPVT